MLLWPNCHTIGFEVRLATKVGTDFCACEKDFLHDHRIALKDGQITEYPTTKFKVVLKEDESRDLFLLSKCVSLTEHDIEEIDADCWLVSQVID